MVMIKAWCGSRYDDDNDDDLDDSDDDIDDSNDDIDSNCDY